MLHLIFVQFIFSCETCHPSCETCNGSSETQCITCKSTYFNLQGKCYKKCPVRFYGDKKRRECLPCAQKCETCDNHSCISCSKGYVLNNEGQCTLNGSLTCDECKLLTMTYILTSNWC